MANAEQRFYNPNRHADWNYGGPKWKLSRSKIDLFLECRRCFYLDNVLGTKRPNFPPFNLNLAVDELFKREFDVYRQKKAPHPLMLSNNIPAIPFNHEKLDIWRENFEGITYTDPATQLLISGAIDDVWITQSGVLIVVDYKATSKDGDIRSISDSGWGEQYTRQLGVYRWLLSQNGFTVQETAYLVYANALKDKDLFNDTLSFTTTLVPCLTSVDWIPKTLTDIKSCLKSEYVPPSNDGCEYCAYRDAAGKKLLALHRKSKVSN